MTPRPSIHDTAPTLRRSLRGLVAASLIGLAIVSAAIPKAAAGELAGVVELFTSQGCNSCPPADETLARLASEGDVLALSFHVDYWNYLGWDDTLSSPANTDRQRGYSRSLGRKSVYTPQAVINGRDDVNGSDYGAIRATLAGLTAQGSGLTVAVRLKADPEGIDVRVGAGEGKANIVAVYYDIVVDVTIERGENAGRTIAYRNSVRSVETIGMWDGDPIALRLPASVLEAHPGRGCAILLQTVSKKGSPGPILGAARIEPEATQ